MPDHLDSWLTQFAAGAAQLPGWKLIEGKLRRLDGNFWCCPLMAQWNMQHPFWCCPLMAQWNMQHPEKYITSSHSIVMLSLWLSILAMEDIHRLMDAADFQHFGVAYGELETLRAQLLAACGVKED